MKPELDRSPVTFKMWVSTKEALNKITAMLTISTGKRQNMTVIIHRLVMQELSRLEGNK